MTPEPKLLEDVFQENLESCFKQIDQVDALYKMRVKAWDHFLELGLPSRKSEVFRYLRMRNLFSQTYIPSEKTAISQETFKQHILPECTESYLVFVNGHFDAALSNTSALPKQVVISPLSQAIRSFGTFLNNYWSKGLKEETDPFVALNNALHPNGLFLYIPPKCVIEKPLQIIYIANVADTPVVMQPRLQVFAGTQSEVQVVVSHVYLTQNHAWINHTIDFAIEDDAHVKFTQTVMNVPNTVWQFNAFRAQLKRNSILHAYNVTDGSASVRDDYRVLLTGENGEALLNGLWMLNERREAHTHILMDHQAPNCHSMQFFKGVLKDYSHSSFEGKILVRQIAQKTEAYQLNHNLILNDGANADSKPNLEIFADDVKASHGATVGQLDEEQVFYMKTRGFSTTEAKSLLVFGFCEEMIEKLPVASLRMAITEKAKSYLK